VPDRPYTAEEVDAAVARLQEPGRLTHAEQVVTHAAPGLQRVLNAALDEGGWFGEAHETEIAKAADEADGAARLTRLRTLLADETRIGMLVGVAVGFELAHELQAQRDTED
jgi:cell division protein ZapA (FtsZ GTPase activity inhibitor)